METSYYKYRPLYQTGTNGVEPHPFTRSIFQNAEIYYAAPRDFNDPFDCNLKLHVNDSTDEEWEEYCDRMIVQNPGRRAQIERVKTGKLWLTEPALSEGVGDESLRMNYERSSVFCLSKKENSIPMFSYYANDHRGIAIELAFSDENVPCGLPFEEENARGVPYGGKLILADVKYPHEFPELNYHRLYNKIQMVENLIFTKHREWAHEDEFRIFRRGVPASNVQFEKRLLKRVIFGCRTTQDDVDMVKGWLGGWPSDVILSKAETADDQFELRIHDFEILRAT